MSETMSLTGEYKCVISDLDDTLLSSDKRITQATREVLEDIMRSGIYFVPATGRPFFAMPDDIFNLKGIQYAITSNGVSIYNVPQMKTVCNTSLGAEVVSDLLELLRSHWPEDCECECFCLGKPYISAKRYNDPKLGRGNKVRADYIRATRTPVTDIDTFIIEHADQVDGIDVDLAPRLKQEVEAAIRLAFPYVYITSSAPDILEISDFNCGKHQAVRQLCRLLNIDISEVLAFGDNDNDAEMIKEAGLGIAVANASPACVAAADIYTQSNDDDGVAKMLRKIFP